MTDESWYDLDTGSAMDAMFRQSVPPDFIELDEFKNLATDFIAWLDLEDRDVSEEYYRLVGSECEHFCLFFLMKYGGEGYHVRLGDYNGAEHYWIVRDSDGLVIDGTLQQFDYNVPQICLSYPVNRKDGYSWRDYDESGVEYLNRNEAFDFYTHPLTGFQPEKKKIVDEFVANNYVHTHSNNW